VPIAHVWQRHDHPAALGQRLTQPLLVDRAHATEDALVAPFRHPESVTPVPHVRARTFAGDLAQLPGLPVTDPRQVHLQAANRGAAPQPGQVGYLPECGISCAFGHVLDGGPAGAVQPELALLAERAHSWVTCRRTSRTRW